MDKRTERPIEGWINKQTDERTKKFNRDAWMHLNKAGYTATPVACGWAGAIFELISAFWQKWYGQRINNIKKE